MGSLRVRYRFRDYMISYRCTVHGHEKMVDAEFKMDGQYGDSFDFTELAMIASDMDGTLLNHDASIHDAVHIAIDDLHIHSKIPMVLATGRCRGSALKRLQARNLDWSSKPGIFLNGALVYGLNGDLVKEMTVEEELLRGLVEHFKDELDSVVVQSCSGDAILSPDASEISTNLHRNYEDPYPTVFGTYENMLNHISTNCISVHMISISTVDDREIERLTLDRVQQVVSRFDDSHEYCVVTPIPRLVTILPRNTSKGSGLLELTRVLNIDPKFVAAIGDANNDIEMLQAVGFPVAMGNAKPELKKHAKLVVNSNDHPTLPGVAQFLRLVVDSHKPRS